VRAIAALTRLSLTLKVALAGALVPAALFAQSAMTVTGHVSAGDRPLQGATIRVPDLGITATTDVDGRYTFIVPSSRVRGQKVTVVARHLRFEPQSADIVLAGGSLTQDFTLPPSGQRDVPTRTTTSGSVSPRASDGPQRVAEVRPIAGFQVDSSVLADLPGPIDLPSALAGRIPGLIVTTPATLGGSAPVLFRGQRSIVATNQPLWVVDGIPIDNSNVSTPAQRFGFGGFDYGGGVQDINLGDVALVQVLPGSVGSALYGGRASNGVIAVTTRSGAGLNGFVVAASQLVSVESSLRLPSFQNTYGQGLNGAYSFFNGRGAGVNDSATQSWGPLLSGQPIPQASLVEPGRGDVRQWLARPDNVTGYFQGGQTFTTNASAQGSNGSGNYRLSFNNRYSRGLTPDVSLARRGAAMSGGARLTNTFSFNAGGQYVNDQGSNRPGTGFDEINPVAGFTRFGRQLDMDALKAHLRDSTDAQITWVYTNRNNPWFQPVLNSNSDERSRWLGGGSASLALSRWFTVSARGGLDSYSETRRFNVETGWIGGYPYYAGRGDFSGGGRERQDIDVRENTAEVYFDLRPTARTSTSTGKTSDLNVALSGGVGRRGNSLHLNATATDRSRDSATTPTPLRLAFDSRTNFLYGSADMGFREVAAASVVVRQETSSVFGGDDSEIYPSVNGSIDLKRAFSSALRNQDISGARVRVGWWRAGSDITPYLLRSIYSGVQSSDGIELDNTATASIGASLRPEITQGLEVGGALQLLNNRLGLDVTLYSERTSDLLIPVVRPSGAVVANAGEATNKGIQMQISAVPVASADGLRWELTGSYAKNKNRLESITGSGPAAMGPSRWGVTVQARPGYPLGAIVGTALRRTGRGDLALDKGVPVADTGTARVLGSVAPSWTGALSNTLRFRGAEVSALLDIRRGGSVFSSTNMWGSYAGVLEATAFRPDSGLLIDGVDLATGNPNTTNVSAQSYYHALGSITEPWVYDASFVKLREVRLSYSLPLTSVPFVRAQSARVSLVGRNLALWAKVPNIDPETALSTSTFQGLELGQLPSARTFGIQLTLTP
jgi:hypothetical protein